MTDLEELTHKLRSFVLTPVEIQVAPVDGALMVIFDPLDVLDNPDAPDVIAEILRGLSAARGVKSAVGGEQIRDAANKVVANGPAGAQVMLPATPRQKVHSSGDLS